MITQNFCFAISEYVSQMKNSTHSDTAIWYCSFVVILLAYPVGLIGNAIVIFVTAFKMKDNKNKIWFLNLAVADLAFLLCVPLDAIVFVKEGWIFGLELCKLNNFLYVCNMFASILIIMALNIDRALSIAKPIWHMRFYSENISYWTCTCMWALALALSIPVYIHSGEYKHGGATYCLPFNTLFLHLFESEKEPDTSEAITNLVKIDNMSSTEMSLTTGATSAQHELKGFSYNQKHCGGGQCCSRQETLQRLQEIRFLGDSFMISSLVLTYIVPLCVILFSNVMVALKVQKSQTVHSSRLYRIIVMVVLVYFLSWTPVASSYVVLLVGEYNENIELLDNMYSLTPLLISISYLNSCLNPIMYVLVSRRIRRRISDMIRMIKSRTSV
ncbi:N-formyl peptide receptor 3-like [Xenopus tropicalis]|uniref:N-formyl peptide receptor 3-like n=1 Tax=Xenopus tropicalis TaxID=8364 RepID=F7DX06_XENTR|nr:N-formyl peptide receptor 3-like [Xenopus tropicalis]